MADENCQHPLMSVVATTGNDLHEINAIEDKWKKWESELIFPVSFDPFGDLFASNILAYVQPFMKVSCGISADFCCRCFFIQKDLTNKRFLEGG